MNYFAFALDIQTLSRQMTLVLFLWAEHQQLMKLHWGTFPTASCVLVIIYYMFFIALSVVLSFTVVVYYNRNKKEIEMIYIS